MAEPDFPSAEAQGWHRADAAGFMPGGMLAILRVRG